MSNRFHRLMLGSCLSLMAISASAQDQQNWGSLVDSIEGITGVFPAPMSENVGVDVKPTLYFDYTTYFAYTDGVIQVRDLATGDVVFSYDPEPGDAQEYQDSLVLDIPEGLLLGGHQYEVTAERLFSRINGEPWNLSAISSGAWQFTVEGGESAVESEVIPGIIDLSPAPGSTSVSLSSTPKITFSAPAHYEYTQGAAIELIDMDTEEVIASFDPEPGDVQENSDTYFVQAELQPDRRYEIRAAHLFARINAEPWNLGAIEPGIWQFTTAAQWQEPEPPGDDTPGEPSDPQEPVTNLPGINLLSPAQGQVNVPVSTKPTITFVALATYGYTDNAYIRIINIDNGEVVAEFDPQQGDAQEGDLTYQLPVDLEADTSYEVQADHLFARINAEPWNMGAIEQGVWQFSTGEQLTESPNYPSDPGTPTPPETPSEPENPDNPGDTVPDTDLSWTSNIPQQRPRLIFDQQRLAAARDWYALNPFEPSSNVSPGAYNFDPVGNAFKYLLTGDAQYADVAITGMLNAVEDMTAQIGGHCDECRWYGEEVILVFDWLNNELSEQQKQELTSKLDEVFDYYLDFYWGAAEPKFAENNYFWGYFRNAALWGIATFHENERAEYFLQRALGERWDNIALSHFNQRSPSGIPAEGVNYGPTMFYYNIGLQLTMKQYGRDLHNETDWYRNGAWWLLYTSLPKPTYDNPLSESPGWTVFPYGDADSFWHGNAQLKAGTKQFISYALGNWKDSGLEGYLRTLAERAQLTDGVPYYLASFDSGNNYGDLSELPTDYFVDGELAYAYTKSSWSDDAAVVNLQLASPHPVGHEHLDSGNWQLWKDGVWASRESPARGYGSNNGQVPGYNEEGMENVHLPVAHNVILVNGKGPQFRQESRGHVQNVTSEDAYFYASVDLSAAYGNASHVSRNFVFIKTLETLVILDRVVTTDPQDKVSFVAHFQQQPDVQSNRYVAQNRHVQTELVTLLPESDFEVRVLSEQRETLSNGQPFDNAHRLVVEKAGNELSLHAVRATNTVGDQLTYELDENDQALVMKIFRNDVQVAELNINKANGSFTSLRIITDGNNAASYTLPMGIEKMNIENDTLEWTNQY